MQIYKILVSDGNLGRYNDVVRGNDPIGEALQIWNSIVKKSGRKCGNLLDCFNAAFGRVPYINGSLLFLVEIYQGAHFLAKT